MKVGDIVRTQVPGFGTGGVSKIGTIVEDVHMSELFLVMHDDGDFQEWYTWQLDVVSDNDHVPL